jgi:YihY family inner membrane protein
MRIPNLRAALTRADRIQRSRPWLALPVAVAKKSGEDRGGSLAALIAYYAFFSLFPLLLAFVTILGFFLQGDPALRQRVVDSALSTIPIIGDRIGQNVHELRGSGLILAVSLVTAIWSGLGVIRASQAAMDDVWDVPKRDRQAFIPSIARAVALLVAFGIALGVSAALGWLGSARSVPEPALRALTTLGAVALNTGTFLVAFRLLTTADVSWRAVLPGSVLAGCAWTGLQLVGGYLVQHQLRSATEIYGLFAVVIGLLSWIYLAAQVTLFSAELNVVLHKRLWPRTLGPPPLNEEDRRAMEGYVQEEARRPEESVDVRFRP